MLQGREYAAAALFADTDLWWITGGFYRSSSDNNNRYRWRKYKNLIFKLLLIKKSRFHSTIFNPYYDIFKFGPNIVAFGHFFPDIWLQINIWKVKTLWKNVKSDLKFSITGLIWPRLRFTTSPQIHLSITSIYQAPMPIIIWSMSITRIRLSSVELQPMSLCLIGK